MERLKKEIVLVKKVFPARVGTFVTDNSRDDIIIALGVQYVMHV